MFTKEEDCTCVGLHAWEFPEVTMLRVKYLKNLRNYTPYIYQFELENTLEYLEVKFEKNELNRENNSFNRTEDAGLLEETSGVGNGKVHLVVLNYSIIKNFKEISEAELLLACD